MLYKDKLCLITIVAACLLANGCNDPGQAYKDINENKDSASVTKPVDSAGLITKSTDAAVTTTIGPARDTIDAGSGDTTIRLKNGEAFVKGHLDADKIRPTYTINAEKGQTIIGIVRPTKKGGNVRINQIQQPGGAFDGPFGDSLSYTLKKTGRLRFIIGENQMAGDRYTGDFILHLRLSN